MPNGSVYLFNIYTNDITSTTLNSGPIGSGGAIPAPVKTPVPPSTAPPYTPNAIAAVKTNATEGQPQAMGLWMVGKANINTLIIDFGGDSLWTVEVYIPGPNEGVAYNTDTFVYIAFEQLYVFDATGANVLQPQNDDKTFAQAQAS